MIEISVKDAMQIQAKNIAKWAAMTPKKITKTNVFGQSEIHFINGIKVYYFNVEWVIISSEGTKYPDTYRSKDKAIARVEKLYPFLRENNSFI